MAIGTCTCTIGTLVFPTLLHKRKKINTTYGKFLKNKVRIFKIRYFSYLVHNDASHSPIHKWLNLPQEEIRQN